MTDLIPLVSQFSLSVSHAKSCKIIITQSETNQYRGWLKPTGVLIVRTPSKKALMASEEKSPSSSIHFLFQVKLKHCLLSFWFIKSTQHNGHRYGQTVNNSLVLQKSPIIVVLRKISRQGKTLKRLNSNFKYRPIGNTDSLNASQVM